MLFTSRTLVEVNATIIVGLLILLTFQFIQPIGTGILEKSTVISLEIDKLEIEKSASEKYLKKLCPNEFNFVMIEEPYWDALIEKNFNQDCTQLILDHIINNEKINTLRERQTQLLEVIPKLMTGGFGILGVIVNGIKNFLLIPFIFAIVMEFIFKRNIKGDESEVVASGFSLKISIAGFVMLGFVLTADSVLSFYEQSIIPLGFDST